MSRRRPRRENRAARRAQAKARPSGGSSGGWRIGGTTTWTRIFYVGGALLVAGSIGAGVLVAAFDDPGDPVDEEPIPTAIAPTATVPEATATAGITATGTPSAEASPAPEGTTMPKQYSAPPPMTIDPSRTYTAILKTEKGDITIRLRPDLAPQHVNSFVFLAREDFYDGVTFHRVLPGFVAQTGDPTGTGMGGPGYNLPAEFSAEPFEPGIVGMARANDPNSAGSQFFITLERVSNLDGQYTVFGEVTDGMDVARAITPRDPQRNPNAPPGDRIVDVEIVES